MIRMVQIEMIGNFEELISQPETDQKFFPIQGDEFVKGSSELIRKRQSIKGSMKSFQEKQSTEEAQKVMRENKQSKNQGVFEYCLSDIEQLQAKIIQPNTFLPEKQLQPIAAENDLDSLSPRVEKPFFVSPSSANIEAMYETIKESSGKEVSAFDRALGEDFRVIEVQQTKKTNNPQRISLVVESERQSQLIPLRTEVRPESVLMRTYRNLWSRYVNVEGEKQREEEKRSAPKQAANVSLKDSRGKKKSVTYDYNGDLIPLCRVRKQISQEDLVSINPLPQNIVEKPKNQFKKRKARIFENQQIDPAGEENGLGKIVEGSDFLKVPERLKQLEPGIPENVRSKNKKITFAEFKRRVDIEKKWGQEQAQETSPKTQKKGRVSLISDCKISLKRVPLKKKYKSQEKVITNYKIFEEIFQVKPRHVRYSSQGIQSIPQKLNSEHSSMGRMESQVDMSVLKNFKRAKNDSRHSYSNFEVKQIDKCDYFQRAVGMTGFQHLKNGHRSNDSQAEGAKATKLKRKILSKGMERNEHRGSNKPKKGDSKVSGLSKLQS